jgi:hypothetical protein
VYLINGEILSYMYVGLYIGVIILSDFSKTWNVIQTVVKISSTQCHSFCSGSPKFSVWSDAQIGMQIGLYASKLVLVFVWLLVTVPKNQ